MNHKNVIMECEMEKETYIKKEVADILDMTPRTVHYYTDQGLVIPVKNPRGRGKTRRYSFENVVQLAVVRELAAIGFDLKTIQQAFKFSGGGRGVISTIGGDSVWILYDGHTETGKISLTASDEKGVVQAHMKDRKVGIIINLDNIRREVQARIEQD